MTSVTRRFPVALSRGTLIYAAAIVFGAGIVLFGINWVFGAAVVHACYLTIMLLQSPARALQGRVRVFAAGWAVLVAIAGFLIGSLGLWPTLIGLAVVALGQGFFRLGEIASMTRSPANFVIFAGLAATGAGLWHVVLGSVLGALFVLFLARFLPRKDQDPDSFSSARDRLMYGIMLAAGSVVIVLLAHWLNFPYANWALLSFCLVLSVGSGNRRAKAGKRMAGTIIGAAIAALAALLPDPLPLVVVGLAAFLCVAYLREGNYILFVSFLTPAILLTIPSELTALELGIDRVEAVVVAVIIALMCSFAAGVFSRSRQTGNTPAD